MKFLTGEWLKSADSDIETIGEIIDNATLTHVVAFHSHQCIEKCFKAVLEEYEIETPKIHNLITLYESVHGILQIELNRASLKKLNELYIDSRYPSDLGLMPYGKPAEKDAQEFFEFAKMVYSKIKQLLGMADLV